jgi:hypothetical protein
MPSSPRELERLLTGKFAFRLAKSRSKDHRYYVLQLEGLPPIRTKVSHSKKQIGATLEAKIARQMRVAKRFWDLMMNCQRDRDAYYEQVRNDPQPPWDILL